MNDRDDSLSIETLTAQALGWVDHDTRSVIPPIYPSTTYERGPDLTYHHDRKYTRADNPTYDQVSELLRMLEGGADAQLFASGMAATVAVFQALKPGDHVIVPENVYGGVRKWLTGFAHPWGIDFDAVPNEDVEALKAALRPGKTKIVWIETPSNPEWRIMDIKASAALAHEAGAIAVADNTVATPVHTRPIELGADIVMHSATKYLNGHGDVLMGALVSAGESELWHRIHEIAHDAGALPGPFETWLLLRGMRTLFLRMERISSNALAVARHFRKHPKVTEVLYPGLPECRGHEVALSQMRRGFGGMLSMRIAGGREKAVAVQAGVKVFKRATSMGTTESLIEHRASYEGPGSPVPGDLLRLAIGIENVSDLIADLEQALAAV
ncbi:MAG: PLP-dependent aspartate aminotransferase family protein [Desulfobacteraceae bacterium]|nr:PLP-dependent aspartate aminotransferase family protein [Desulfobacteraceae bacterium]